MALNTCFRVTGWPCVKLFDIDRRWLTYSPENNVGVSSFSLCTRKWKGLSHVKCVSYPEHVLGSVDDTWSQYLILTSYELHTALKVTRGLRFQWKWLNGIVACEACYLALSICFRVTEWHMVTTYETDLIWPSYSRVSNKGSQVSALVIQWNCHMWSVLGSLEHMF